MPPTYVSDSQDLPIDPDAGLYPGEAIDGRYKAYTVLFVSKMALVTRTSNGAVLAYAVDRKTGAPLSNVQVRMGIKQQQVAEAETGDDGVAELHVPVSKAMQENIWLIAKSSKDVAAVTPASYAFSGLGAQRRPLYVYTDRPAYRPGHTVHWKAILRKKGGEPPGSTEAAAGSCNGKRPGRSRRPWTKGHNDQRGGDAGGRSRVASECVARDTIRYGSAIRTMGRWDRSGSRSIASQSTR